MILKWIFDRVVTFIGLAVLWPILLIIAIFIKKNDILNRVVVTVKDELVSILPHKWVEPVTIPLVY